MLGDDDSGETLNLLPLYGAFLRRRDASYVLRDYPRLISMQPTLAQHSCVARESGVKNPLVICLCCLYEEPPSVSHGLSPFAKG